MTTYYEIMVTVDDDWIRTELEWANDNDSNFTEEQINAIVARCTENAESFKTDRWHGIDTSVDVFYDALADQLRSWINDVAGDLLGDEVL